MHGASEKRSRRPQASGLIRSRSACLTRHVGDARPIRLAHRHRSGAGHSCTTNGSRAARGVGPGCRSMHDDQGMQAAGARHRARACMASSTCKCARPRCSGHTKRRGSTQAAGRRTSISPCRLANLPMSSLAMLRISSFSLASRSSSGDPGSTCSCSRGPFCSSRRSTGVSASGSSAAAMPAGLHSNSRRGCSGGSEKCSGHAGGAVRRRAERASVQPAALPQLRCGRAAIPPSAPLTRNGRCQGRPSPPATVWALGGLWRWLRPSSGSEMLPKGRKAPLESLTAGPAWARFISAARQPFARPLRPSYPHIAKRRGPDSSRQLGAASRLPVVAASRHVGVGRASCPHGSAAQQGC